MTSRKPPSAAFWATVVVVVALVAYPLSWGIWLRCMPVAVLNENGAALVAWGFYSPLYALLDEPLMWPYARYVEWISRVGR
jgi:hypothetical protein